MIVKCQRCGAPLDVSEDSRFVTCEYCGATTVLGKSKSVPPQIPELVSQAIPPGKSSRGSKAIYLLVAAGVVVVLVGAMIPELVKKMSSSGGLSGVVTNVMGPSAWSTDDPACLVDANSDGVLDIAGLSGKVGATKTPTVIDGATGKVLWKRRPTSKAGRIACLGHRWFAVWQPDFKIYFYDAAGSKQPTVFTGTDKLNTFGVGRDCVVIETADKKKNVLSLGGASPGECHAGTRHYVYESLPGHVGLTKYSSTFHSGVTTVTIMKKRSGTKMLTIQVQKPGGPSWTKHLTWMSPTFGSAVALGQGVVLVWAAKPGHADKNFLVGLDEETGNQLYAVRAPGRATDIGSLQFNDRYFVATYALGLRAFDPKTGKVAWAVGQ